MKKKFIILLLLIAVSFLVRDVNAAQSVNVEQYLEMVRNQNHSILAAAKGIEAAYYQVLSSVGHLRLKAGISASASFYTKQSAAGGNNYNPVGYSVTPTISQVIDISGVHSLSERQSILGYETIRAAFDNTVNSILASAEHAYWGVVMARDNVALQKDVLRARHENLRVTEEKYNQQLVPKLDVIRATSAVSDAQNSIVNAEGTLLNRLAALKNFAGGADVVPKDTNFLVPELSIGVNESIALRNHPSVRQKKILLAQSEVQKQIAKKGMAPTLGASASWNMLYGSSAGSGFEFGENVTVGLSMNIPIADGNQTKYDTLNKSASAQAAMENLLESEASVILNLTVALNDWYIAKSLEENMKQQVERSNEELKITELMYNEGMGSQLDLITAQTENQTVRTNYINAVMGMYSAIVSLRQAMGDYSPAVEGTWKDALVKYGTKGSKKIADNNDEVLHQNEEIFVNVQGTNVPQESAIEWLKGEKQPEALVKQSSINVPLTKKKPDGSFETINFNNETNITMEEALEWLKK